jgi:hypothetical protein
MSHICSGLVGFGLLVSGFGKALHSLRFLNHLRRFALIPEPLLPPLCVSLIALECVLGMGLLLSIVPAAMVPAATFFILTVTAISIWGSATGKVSHCGCYGEVAMVTQRQSMVLNATYLAALTIAWMEPLHASFNGASLQTLALTTAVAVFMAGRSSRGPLIDLSRIKPGKRWRSAWLPLNPQILRHSRLLVAFVEPHCPRCKKWLRSLQQLAAHDDQVTLLVVAPETRESTQPPDLGCTGAASAASMSRELFYFLVGVSPTVIEIQGGIITERWIDTLPIGTHADHHADVVSSRSLLETQNASSKTTSPTTPI